MQFVLSTVMALTFGLAMFQCDKAKIDNTLTATNTVATNQTVQTQTPDDGAPHITLADAKADYDAGRAIIIDARGADSYKVEHIKGAINIPLADFSAQYKNIPTNKKLIVYCS